MTRLMHLSCPRKSEIITGNQGISQEEHKNRAELSKEGCIEESFKEIPPDNLLLLGGSTPKMVKTEPTRSMKNHPLNKRGNSKVHSRCVIISYLLKEEPPDAQSILKPKQYQGYPVSRSKLCQGGGYDAAIRSATEPEANFYGFYTQEGVQANWNWAKIFTEQEVMNFTSQRFLSPSICEYTTLEEDSSPKKKRTEPKPIIGVKRSLLDFQKAQDLEKWPRKLEDMINFPKLAKPALHLPYLEDLGFTSNQPQEWQPGDLISHSEALQNILGSIMPHWIRRSGQLHQHPGDQADLSSHQPSIFGSNYTKCFEEVSTDIYSRPKPYSPSRQLRDMSGKLLDHGYIQKLSRYKIIQDSLVKAQLKLMASSHGAIKSIDSKHFISIYFLSLVHFQTVRESLVEPINLLSLCEATPKHLDLSRLLSIESCGVLNPPSFHSNSFAKLESDTHPASKAPSQSTSIIN
ncbi:hypothetical protein F2Q69_00059891 [Brassica cretica]|uniref:Uncharacterized protein n=1 Tax=Brassica cretica TaxID=69181 RepID=A0A8S9RB11_BRACR|nr:hypothetical protein F2Q69_00059891 [Brassica cretica]